MTMTNRAITLLFIAAIAFSTNDAMAQAPADEAWAIEITPARGAAPAPVEGEAGKAVASASSYTRIYNSIPFSRSDYNANPNYRHDSTMEILTGNSRHLTVVRRGQPVSSAPARTLSPRQVVAPYGYVRPSLRLNYYRHFPSLNPYWNIMNFSGIR